MLDTGARGKTAELERRSSCSSIGNMIDDAMQLIARKHLVTFWAEHPETEVSLRCWEAIVRAASWNSTAEIQAAFPKAKVLNADRVRFEVHHNDYRLVAAFDLVRQIAFVKFIGNHKQYDAVDALTVSLF